MKKCKKNPVCLYEGTERAWIFEIGNSFDDTRYIDRKRSNRSWCENKFVTNWQIPAKPYSKKNYI